MLDFRHQTFLELYEIKNYTKTAQKLHITQPAVSQHIQFLEHEYGAKLFQYEKKRLQPTEAGHLLYQLAQKAHADVCHLKRTILEGNKGGQTICMGATRTIGEFVLPPLLARLGDDRPEVHISVVVDNTKTLLEKIEQGEISFAFIEGLFDKTKFGHALYSLEPFIGVCSAHSPLCTKKVELSSLLTQRIILRERGSGTRDIFEQLLKERNLPLGSLPNTIEIGNMNAIKWLVKQNKGITFLYETAVREELLEGSLKKIWVKEFDIKREFNFVYMKDSAYHQTYREWFLYWKSKTNC